MKKIIRAFGLIVCFQLFCCVNVVQAQVQFEQSFYYDETTKLTIDDVNGIDFQPFSDDLRQGIFKGSTWIKVVISKSKDFDRISREYNVFPLVVGLGNFNLDHIEMYEAVNGLWTKQVVDHINLQRPRICNDDLHCFNLKTHLINPEFETVYLKIDTQSFRTLHVEVRPQNLLASSSIVRVFRISTTLAFGFCLFLLAFIFYAIERSQFLLAFALFELSIISYLYVSSGINYNLFDIHFHIFTFALPLTLFNLRLILFIWLCYLAIVDYSPSRQYVLLCKGCLFLAFVALLLPVADLRSQSLELNLCTQALVVILNIYAVFHCKKIPFNIKYILLTGYGVYLFLFFFGLIYSVGWFEFVLHQYIGFRNYYDFRLNGMPIGIVVFSIVVIQILTSKKNAYQALADAKINEAKVFYLNEKLAEREDMAEVLSHEVKNPLSTIRFASNSIQNSATVGSDLHARATVINRSASRIDDLINQVYLSNQLDKKIFQDEVSDINLSDFFIELVGEFNAMHRFNLEIPIDLSIKSNEFLLNTIFTNLIGNSIKYASPNSIIDVSVFLKDQIIGDSSMSPRSGVGLIDQNIVFLISNEVESLSLPDPEKVFQRYYRHDNFLTKPGMGIGLNIVKSATDLLNGTISYSVSNSIVSFNVEIPKS